MSGHLIHWIIFAAVIAAALAIDFAAAPAARRVTLRRAAVETCAWIGLATLFGAWIFATSGRQRGAEFFAAYVLEKSLSADNIFVFLLVFRAFAIDPRYQHRVLFAGIAGALVLRLAFILAGVQILSRLHWALYVFGAALVALGVRMVSPGHAFRPEQSRLMRLVRKIHPVDASYQGDRFWVVAAGRRAATPLLLALVAIEALDVVFAVDSVPAVLAITRDPFVAYSSNIFAVLGLRAMYFGLAELMLRMRFLHQSLAAILVFVGAKMLLSDRIAISASVSLAVILAAIGVAALASWLAPAKSP